ncbi:MAG: non-hydrolyzing UDP-N-acetylglucosamine 2-epimerase [Bacillota bacterium]
MIGTRPEAIKLAPVARALADLGVAPTLTLTGQHPALDPADFGLDSFPEQRLDCPGEQDPHRHVGAVMQAVLPLLAPAPDLVVVQGDTSSALGGALAGFSRGVPVAHVEAGLRTFDPRLPWPEEEYRTAIDANAQLLFAPTETAAANLRAERVPGEIHVTGNTSIDAVLAAEAALPPPPPRRSSLPLLLVTAHRRESWGEGLRSIAAALTDLSADAEIDFVLHPNPHVAATMRELLGGHQNIRLVEPCGHRELVQRIRSADLVLSDSGGIQEEAPALGVPLLVLREKTERPEGIAEGSATLVGTSTKRIVTEARQLLADRSKLGAMRRRAFPYGDGKSGPRIAVIIDEWLKRK